MDELGRDSAVSAAVPATATEVEDDANRARKAWRAPRLSPLGSLRDLTLGGSPGLEDSAAPTLERS